MKKLVLACGILVSLVSLSMGAMSDEEWERARYNCFENEDKSACQALINNGLPSVEQCDKDNCVMVGYIHYLAGQEKSFSYFQKAIALGDNATGVVVAYHHIGLLYNTRQDYAKAAELYKKACDMKYAESCNLLGYVYRFGGNGVKQNFSLARQYFSKACDLGLQVACELRYYDFK